MANFAMKLAVLLSPFCLGQDNSTKTGVDIARQTIALRIGVCWTKTHSYNCAFFCGLPSYICHPD